MTEGHPPLPPPPALLDAFTAAKPLLPHPPPPQRHKSSGSTRLLITISSRLFTSWPRNSLCSLCSCSSSVEKKINKKILTDGTGQANEGRPVGKFDLKTKFVMGCQEHEAFQKYASPSSLSSLAETAFLSRPHQSNRTAFAGFHTRGGGGIGPFHKSPFKISNRLFHSISPDLTSSPV